MERTVKDSNEIGVLVRKAKTADRGAMEELYLATYSELWSTVRAMTKNDSDAMDVMQESYLNAFSHLKELRKPEQFSAWLKRIAVNEIKQQLRKKQPLLFTELDAEENIQLPEPPYAPTPERILEQKEQTHLVQKLLSELPDGQRTILVLYYCEQYSIKEIAQQLGVSQGTVKTQLHHGRKKLEAAMRKSGYPRVSGVSVAFLLSGWRGAQSAPAQLQTGAAVVKLLPQSAAITVKSTTSVVLGRIAVGAAAVAIVVGSGFGASALARFLREKEQPLPPPTPPIHEAVKTSESKTTDNLPVRLATPADPAPETEEIVLPATPADPAPTEPKPTEPKPTEPKPTDPMPTEPKPTEPKPSVPQPSEPNEPPATPADAPLPPVNPADTPEEAESSTLPTQWPYPFEYQEVTMPVGSIWHTSFKTDAEWKITPFVHTPNLSSTRNIADSYYAQGEQRIAIVLNEPGVIVYSLFRENVGNAIKLVQITVTETED